MAITVPALRVTGGRAPRRTSELGPRSAAARQRIHTQRPLVHVGRSTGATVAGRSLPRSSQAARRERLQSAPRQPIVRTERRSARRYLVVALLGFVVGAMVLLLPGLSAQASRGVPESPAQSVVTVRAGDSLWSVAKRSMPDVDTRSAVIELRKANNLRGTDLVVGQRLVVPGK